ncbi:glycine-tRNA synthetase, beta subunit [Escherichia coli]|nr:glycine-tRNA synthetase, beta subunit [Escherichia coli]
MSEKTFLVEIGTEELPPKALRSLAESFAANFTAELDNAGLAHGTVQWFAAPRRLALKVANLAEAQPDREIEKRGPAIAQAFDAEGKPSKAAEGWARGCGITVDQAERLTTDKGEWLLYRAHVKGESTEALLPNMVATSLAKLPNPETDALGRKRRALRASGAHRDPAAGRQSHSGNHSGHSVRSRDSRPPLYGRAGIHHR